MVSEAVTYSAAAAAGAYVLAIYFYEDFYE
jgi:hypothetical protein